MDTTQDTGTSGTTSTSTPAGAPMAPVTPGHQDHDPAKPPAWLAPRLEEAKAAAVNQLLKTLGFQKPEDLQTRLAKAKELEDSQLTEQQRVTKELEDLRVRAADADRYRQMSSELAEQQFAALPANERAALEDMPPLERVPFITRFAKARMVGAGTVTPVITEPAVKPAHTAPPGTPPPPVGSSETAFEKWQKLPAGSTGASLYYSAHRQEIEASRK